jgi:PKD repeat protein
MSLEFSTSPSTKGDVYATTFTFNKTTLPTYTITTWDFGDGNFAYNQQEASHIYNFPGVYRVALSAWSAQGQLETASELIDVDYILRDAIIIDQIPSRWGLPGLPSVEPFVVSLTSAKIDEPLSIVLQALNTKSVPHYAVPEKWNFLVPKWRFVDASTNQILDGPIPLSTTPIYKDSTIIAMKGQASFYYIDDLATGTDPTRSCPLLITATLST